MKKRIPGILIIGGGVAGMAAAQAFIDHEVIIHLVEKETDLGGHAAKWACMATDVCENCGACLVLETKELLLKQKNVTLHLNTLVKDVKRKKQGYEVTLEDKTLLKVDKVIVAAGFTPFDPVCVKSLHHGEYENVITTAELNTILRSKEISDYFNGKHNPRIAFIQCVGSRNREQGRDYCSQVCCKISMRHANKLNHLFPESDITLFYMDLQIIGKEIRPLARELAKNISLVQGVPGEIRRDPGTNMLSIVAEDGKNRERVLKTYDLIVLSIGMQPGPDIKNICTMFDIKQDRWGFINADQALLPEDIEVAGCSRGPGDILTSEQDGQNAAARVMDALGLGQETRLNIAVFGQGAQADQVAEIISSKGYQTFLFGTGATLLKETRVKIIDKSRLISIQGTAGNFSVYYNTDSRKKFLKCVALIAAFEPDLSVPGSDFSFNCSVGINEFLDMIEKEPGKCPDNNVILLDYSGPESKSFARAALDLALKIKKLGRDVSIIMHKMLVHGSFGQRLYDKARNQGIVFLRYETREDLKFEETDRNLVIKLREATLPSIELTLNCDSFIIPPLIIPGKGFKNVSELLGQPLDKEGFLQSANVRHRLTQSFRKGVFFAGRCHDDTDSGDLENEIQNILLSLKSRSFYDQTNGMGMETEVRIDEKLCAKCLTCIRICPHSAIILNEKSRPEIMPHACFACHLCVSNCPACAIKSNFFENDQIIGKVEKNEITVFACERSAALAAEGLNMSEKYTLIPISCACRISTELILKTFLNGASKVIVAGCHEDNCRSKVGRTVAKSCIRQVSGFPGIDSTKITWEPVSANEDKKFQRIISISQKKGK